MKHDAHDRLLPLIALYPLLLSVFGIGFIHVPTPVQIESEAQEYVVYSALINDRFATGDVTKPIVIRDQTTSVAESMPDWNGEMWQEILASSGPMTSEDFMAKNQQRHSLHRNFNLEEPYVLRTRQEKGQLFSLADGWDAFYNRYSGLLSKGSAKQQGLAQPHIGADPGYIVLSRVGFNPARDQASVYVRHRCGGKCDGGTLFLLRKRGGVWEIYEESLLWIN